MTKANGTGFGELRVELGLQDFKIKQKCTVCKSRGLTLTERADKFECTVCHTTEKLDYWYSPFLHAPDLMTFKQASELIQAGKSGSTLRWAKSEGRLQTSGRITRKDGKESKKENLISKKELLTFYLTKLNRRPKKKVALAKVK